MDKPVRTDEDSRLPLTATIAIGGLALFGAVTLVGWIIGAVVGLAKFAIAAVVIIALVGWIAGRRLEP